MSSQSQSSSRKRKRPGCKDGNAETVRKFLVDIEEGDCLMSGDKGVTKVIKCIMEVDKRLKSQDEDLKKADSKCAALREEDKIEWQEALDKLRKQHAEDKIEFQNAIEKLRTEFGLMTKSQEAQHAADLAKLRVNGAMLAFRQIAVDIRDYYAVKVGGVKLRANKQVDNAELRDFLKKVGSDAGKNPELVAKLVQKIKEDGQFWTWETLINFCTFANKYAHPSIDAPNTQLMNLFLENEDLTVDVHTWQGGVTKKEVKPLLKSFLGSHYSIFRYDD